MTQSRQLLLLLLLVTLVKGIIYSIIVPLWEFPDEQAHFAQVTNLAENHPPDSENDLSREIYFSEDVMGTLRDNRGINRYTYHPDYKPEYSTSTIGPRELEIIHLPPNFRQELVKSEAASYPPLFYQLSSLAYRVVYPANLLIRVFAVRLASVFFATTTVFFAYQLGLQVFQSSLMAITLATITTFHPMFSFVSAGINNDNLLNLFGMILLYSSAYLINHRLSYKLVLASGITYGLGIQTKPLVLPLIIPVIAAILIEWYRSRRSLTRQLKYFAPFFLPVLFIAGNLLWTQYQNTGRFPYLPAPPKDGYNLPLTQYLLNQTRRYYTETFVWYWGVFKWLGVIMPLWVYRLFKLLFILAAIGLAKLFSNRSLPSFKLHAILQLISSLSFLILLTLWDYLLINSMAYSHGLQGRYFFSTLGSHLSLLLLGLVFFFPSRFQATVAKSTGVIFILTQLISWNTLIHTYYQTYNLTTLLLQMSQYKPFFLKFPYMLIYFMIYFSLLLLFTLHYLKLPIKPPNHECRHSRPR